jgi:hypothetical protein
MTEDINDRLKRVEREIRASQVETLVAALKMIRDGSHSWSVDATDLAREALRKVGRAE